MSKEPLVITISHQLGSGGAYIGQKLSEQLKIPFVDREILKRVAEQLNLAESELQGREERLSSFWESFSRIAVLADPEASAVANHYVPTDRELFQLESDYIGRIAERTSAIVIGRCARYILRDHPNHVSLFVHADRLTRVKRLMQLFNLSETDAEKMTITNDKERSAYIQNFTRKDWLDARLYDLCVNTSAIGMDHAVELSLAAINAKTSPRPSIAAV